MKKIFKILIIFIILGVSGCGSTKKAEIITKEEEKLTEINIAWMEPGSFFQPISTIFTKELEKNGLKVNFEKLIGDKYADYIRFNDFDVIFLNDLTVALITKTEDVWSIIGRTGNYRLSIHVPPRSPINNIVDLKGKKIAGTITMAGMVFRAMEGDKKGENIGKIDFSRNFDFIEMSLDKQREIVYDPDAIQWEGVDALAGHDPFVATLEEKELTKVIYADKIILPIIMKNDYIEQNPEAPVKLLKSFQYALTELRKEMIKKNKEEFPTMNPDIIDNVLKKTFSFDSNFNEDSKEDIRLSFNEKEIDILQGIINLVYNYPPTKESININDYIDMSFLEKVQEQDEK